MNIAQREAVVNFHLRREKAFADPESIPEP